MDDAQKSLLESAVPELANTLDFNLAAQELQRLDLVTRDQVENIKKNHDSRFKRNLQLLEALKGTETQGALEKFINYLEGTQNIKALKILRPMNNSTSDTYRNVINRFANTFRRPTDYILGIGSHRSNHTAPYQSTGGYIGSQDESITSPMKEKHQATLITSGSGSSSSSSSNGSDPNINLSGSNHINNSQSSQQHQLQSSQQQQLLSQLQQFSQNSQIQQLSQSSQQQLLLQSQESQQQQQSQNSSANFELPRKNLSLPPLASSNFSGSSIPGPNNLVPSQSNNLHLQPASTSSTTEQAQYGSNRSLSGGGTTDTGDDTGVEQQQAEGGGELALWHPYEQTSSSLHYCSQSTSLASSQSSSGSASPSFERNIILDSGATMAITRSMEHRKMKVKMATLCHNNLKKDYPMTARPRGPCLIVNNVDFDADIFPTRKGSDEDAKRFDDIFTQLGFTVIMRRNQTADEMRKLFKDVASECRQEHNALFVFILSHGSEHGIYGKDGLEVYLESEIISCFDNRNCEAMIGKPKVFVIQACRGGGTDYGGDDTTDSIAWPPSAFNSTPSARPAQCIPQSAQSVQSVQTHSSRESSTGDRQREYPIRTDMLLVFSCLAGYVSVRNETAGSWLGTSLAFYIMKYAHKEDFNRILHMVTEDVTGRKSSQGLVQSIEVRQLGWKKNLYFNPGIYL